MGSSMYAYVTLVTSDSYAAGALVLGHQLKDNGTPHDLVCLVTNNVSPTVVHQLQSLFTIVPVETLVSQDIAHLNLLGRPDLIHTFTKCHVWRLETYQKLVFLDADTLPLGNVDELFDRPHFSAAPDAGWPDCFNSGMFVTCPSKTTYDALLSLANQEGSFDGGDQGLLNRYFDQWHRLPFTYNTTPTSQYSYAPAHQFYQHNISICHFIGLNKPWKYQRFDDGKVLSHEWDGLTQLLQAWWDTWQKHYGEVTLTSPAALHRLRRPHSLSPCQSLSWQIGQCLGYP
ncbi:nucleotide-diphospho-sugar transferase [Hesseltinella vesiculosa]|uniref:glycogenin glucosyltransferase n=1 Tax=Hesseltinella vesiculosa TaxID=101127 RepID=A0A1X2GLE4_9FUNG|nr:nucleotide-diphospho-sugar transferase [Hesseltinella vesiculosa]